MLSLRDIYEYHYNTFKKLPICDQISKANSILQDYDMQLVVISTQIEMLNFEIKKILAFN